MLLLAAVFLYASVSLIGYAMRSVSTRRTNEALQAIYEEAMEASAPEAMPASAPEPASAPASEPLSAYQYIGETILPEMQAMVEKNADTVAWLRIPGVVSLPVVYRDNTYYLNHDFNGRKNSGGTLFLDEAHPFAADTQYMVIHGHNMHDGSMFGLLAHYRKRGYMQEHPTVYLNTLYRQEVYEVVGVLYTPGDAGDDEYVSYVGMRKFGSPEQFSSFARRIRESALYWREDAELLPGDALLALSTCYDDDRVVVMCRRIDE